jgi:hypothetical protein
MTKPGNRATRLSLIFLLPAIAILVLSLTLKSFALLLLSGSIVFFGISYSYRRFSNPLVFMASLLFALSFAEWFLSNVSGPLNETYYISDHYSAYHSRPKPYGNVPSEGVYEASRKTTDTEETIYNATYTIGHDGFRVTPDNETENISKTINIFGGSYVFGEGLDDDETLPYFWTTLNKTHRVKNYGMHGWGVHNALALLRSGEVSGDVNVLVTVPWHALRSSCTRYWVRTHPKYVLNDRGELIRQGKCGQGRRIQNLLEKVLKYSFIYTTFVEGRKKDKITREMITLYIKIIGEIASTSQRNGQAFIVGFMGAERYRFKDALSNEEIFEEIRNVAPDVVDVTLAARVEDLDDQYYIHELDKHPTGKANKERAMILSGKLAEVTESRVVAGRATRD